MKQSIYWEISKAFNKLEKVRFFFIKYVFDIQNWKKGKRLFGAMQRTHGKAIKQIILICPPTGDEQQYNACIKLWLYLLQYFSCQGIIEVWVDFTSHGKDSSLVEFAPMKLVINFMPNFSFHKSTDSTLFYSNCFSTKQNYSQIFLIARAVSMAWGMQFTSYTNQNDTLHDFHPLAWWGEVKFEYYYGPIANQYGNSSLAYLFYDCGIIQAY